ncbi:uncharacterized protein LAESUDRAFT_717344 [Laetiporus sulphureus 93-53]|uniref:Uncharacterized protein n=1 Tax=Laetiporus sulphureus 93-53 TaxID=1314785 RepID=A0A165BU96_9APHY|nr:uncharacterized protein LAESUDRAFT_717344 [Laetiporus sulphureus 93-53]KZT01661.1 hypothetical protein LAESUDRAFT_717344 [Laetiporus sulphureus 93-53]
MSEEQKSLASTQCKICGECFTKLDSDICARCVKAQKAMPGIQSEGILAELQCISCGGSCRFLDSAFCGACTHAEPSNDRILDNEKESVDTLASLIKNRSTLHEQSASKHHLRQLPKPGTSTRATDIKERVDRMKQQRNVEHIAVELTLLLHAAMQNGKTRLSELPAPMTKCSYVSSISVNTLLDELIVQGMNVVFCIANGKARAHSFSLDMKQFGDKSLQQLFDKLKQSQDLSTKSVNAKCIPLHAHIYVNPEVNNCIIHWPLWLTSILCKESGSFGR